MLMKPVKSDSRKLDIILVMAIAVMLIPALISFINYMIMLIAYLGRAV